MVQFFVPMEAAFYHAQAKAIAASHPKDNDLFSLVREDLRRLCCHPAASKELRQAFVLAGGRLHRSGGQDRMPLESLDTLSARMIRGREAQLTELRQEMSALRPLVQLADNTVRVLGEIEQRRLVEHTTQIASAAGGPSAARKQPFVFTEEDLRALSDSGMIGLRLGGEDGVVRGVAAVIRHIDRNMRGDEERRVLLANSRRFVTVSLETMRGLEKSIREVRCTPWPWTSTLQQAACAVCVCSAVPLGH